MTLDPFVESIFGNCHICMACHCICSFNLAILLWKAFWTIFTFVFLLLQSALYVQSALYCMYKVLLSGYSLSKAYSNNTCSVILGVFKLLLYAKDVWQWSHWYGSCFNAKDFSQESHWYGRLIWSTIILNWMCK